MSDRLAGYLKPGRYQLDGQVVVTPVGNLMLVRRDDLGALQLAIEELAANGSGHKQCSQPSQGQT